MGIANTSPGYLCNGRDKHASLSNHTLDVAQRRPFLSIKHFIDLYY